MIALPNCVNCAVLTCFGDLLKPIVLHLGFGAILASALCCPFSGTFPKCLAVRSRSLKLDREIIYIESSTPVHYRSGGLGKIKFAVECDSFEHLLFLLI